MRRESTRGSRSPGRDTDDVRADEFDPADGRDMARALWARGVFPHQFSWLIDSPLRRLVLSPETLVKRLPLTDSSRVLELGPGSGYFSAALAARIPRGRLELFDLQPEMLAKAGRKLRAGGHQNIGYTTGNAGEDLPFPDGHFDVAFLSSVLGEVPDQGRCLRSLHRVLCPTGTLAVHESIPDPDLIRFGTLQGLVEHQGFRFLHRWGRPWNYTATSIVKSERSEAKSAA